MVTFGGTALPNVLTIQMTDAHKEVEKAVPNRSIAHRMNEAELGRTIQVSGEIRETTIDAVASDIETIRSLNDGTARTLDLQDGTATFYALLTDPAYTLSTDGWYEAALFSNAGRFTVPYTVTFLQTSEAFGHWNVDLIWDYFGWA